MKGVSDFSKLIGLPLNMGLGTSPMRLHELLNEGRDAPLFHACGWANALSIVRSDTMQARTSHEASKLDPTQAGSEITGVSLTRDRLMAHRWGEVVFEFDQAKLAHRHRIVAIDYWGRSAEAKMFDRRRRDQYAEAEEFVVGPINRVGTLLRGISASRASMARMNRNYPGWSEGEGAALCTHSLFSLT